MRRVKAFTLIEVLVVIGVIALLMAMLLPALDRARRQAKTIFCQTNLKQWGSILAIYLDDHDGHFFKQAIYGTGICLPWMYSMRDYCTGAEGIANCPTANQLANPLGQDEIDATVSGGTFLSWGKVRLEINDEFTPFYSGSYGLNSWLYYPTVIPLWGPEEYYWRTTQNVVGVSKIPVLLDGSWWSSRPKDIDIPPPYEDYPGRFPCDCRDAMVRFCIDRHDGGINSLFLDGSVRKVGLKELWTLKWHKEFNTANEWTKAGGVHPRAWPEWMRKFTDY